MKTKILPIINQILLYSLLLGSLISFLYGKINYGSTFLGFFIFSFLIFIFIKKKKLPEHFKLLIIIMVWLHMIGEVTRLYYTYEYYDKILHLISPILITYMIVKYIEKKKIGLIAIFFMVLGLTALFEMWEFLLSSFLNIQMVGVFIGNEWRVEPLLDTMMDLTLGIIGSILYLTFYKIREKRSKPKLLPMF